VQRVVYGAASGSLTLEILSDDLVHFEMSGGPADPAAPLPTTPMVARSEHAGPSRFTDDGRGALATADLQLKVAPDLCLTVTDAAREPAAVLTTICPAMLGAGETVLGIAPQAIRHVYGLGEHFYALGEADGDWVGKVVEPGSPEGNAHTPFGGGFTGNAQFPIMYALGEAGESYALFLDHPYPQRWDFSGDPWEVRTSGGALRGYLLSGPDLPALRRAYLELVGRPPVPPRRMFGLWVSEFGYDEWAELEDKLATLRANHFPVDGFVLDLQWFGGVFQRPSHMGALTFDESHFPDAAAEIARLRDEGGVGVMVIEESYVDASRPEHAALAERGGLARRCEGCVPVRLTSWWGSGGMLDWTNDSAADDWHDQKRQPLVDMGILGHWTDLGEPESYDPSAWYFGFPALGLHAHADVHNLYNLKWIESIARGYARRGVRERPFILSRSGTAGVQRFGAALWSGDIGSNLASLAAHLNVQMHMSFSGIDYFGADVGGFWRTALEGDLDEVYTRWFADAMLLDAPARPHTLNTCNCNETAPDRIGDAASNLENLRLRYRLIPYLYSLAHRAHLYGEPVVPPLVFYHQDDPAVREIGDEKLLGRDLLVAAVSNAAAERDVYLPRGTWVDYHTGEWLVSTGEWLASVPLHAGGVFRLPLFARAGAIVPEMAVDERTMNSLGLREDGSLRDELILRVYADEAESSFTLYEDDGVTIAYQEGALRTTRITQQRAGDRVTITIGPASGSYAGAPESRDNVVELHARDAGVLGVELNGSALGQKASRAELDAAETGWYSAGTGVMSAKSGRLPVSERKTFEVRLRRE
jgi:alpha-glucosidase